MVDRDTHQDRMPLRTTFVLPHGSSVRTHFPTLVCTSVFTGVRRAGGDAGRFYLHIRRWRDAGICCSAAAAIVLSCCARLAVQSRAKKSGATAAMDTSSDVWDAHWRADTIPCRRRIATSSSGQHRPTVAATPLQQGDAKRAEQGEHLGADASGQSSSWTWRRSGPSDTAATHPGARAAATAGAADTAPARGVPELVEPPRCCACELVIPYKITVCHGVVAAVTQSLLQHMLFVRGQIPWWVPQLCAGELAAVSVWCFVTAIGACAAFFMSWSKKSPLPLRQDPRATSIAGAYNISTREATALGV